ncbi:MAG: hypothetical protein K2F57_06105, partial [Candidatus Gastranaerophilales bacterium]|nr:hypothetical protein [Candidatus Gastranaerophilales bacterium]
AANTLGAQRIQDVKIIEVTNNFLQFMFSPTFLLITILNLMKILYNSYQKKATRLTYGIKRKVKTRFR